MRTKVERGNRVFPVSDHSSDVIGALTKELHQLGVSIHLHTEVKRVVGEGRFEYLETKDGKKITGDACIVATGGFSYQTTGSTGDGYRFARELGHTVTQITPSLVPFYVKETCAARMQGLALKNVQVRNPGRKKAVV